MTNLNRYKYKFSFVMPVYNVEKYLDETVQSVLDQSMDFEQNCEIIFVNDGSPDNVEEVCLKYKSLYPNNIKYIKQNNQGVSAARNRGLKEVEGKYVNFLDSDDKISLNTLERVYDFFESHYEEIDFCSIKLDFFDAKTGSHPLNYKYDSTKVVDVNVDYDFVQLSASSSFVKTEIIEKLKFDTRLQTAEDATFLTQILMNGKMAYGVIKEPVYYYRKRTAQNSAISGSLSNPSWYWNTTEFAYKFMLDESEKMFGHIPRYVQFLVMYDLQWRLKQSTQSILNTTDLERYKRVIANLIKRIDDEIILAQRSILVEHKILALSLKYDEDVMKETKVVGGVVRYRNNEIYDYKVDKYEVVIDAFELRGAKLHIEGYFKGLIAKNVSLQLFSGNSPEDCKWREVKYRRFYWLNNPINPSNNFSVGIDISAGQNLYFRVFDGANSYYASVSFRMFSRINPIARWSYRTIGNYILRKRGAGDISVYTKTKLNLVRFETIYLFGLAIRVRPDLIKSLIKEVAKGDMSKLRDLITIPVKSVLKNIYSISVRMTYYLYRPFAPKNIWLISDRIILAGDNGEAFFKYLAKLKPDNITYIFTVSKKSSDYARMQTIGRVINRDSFHYKLLFLCSNKVISSQAEHNIFNAFGNLWTDFADLYKFKFVFLQHGITKDDLSGWLNKQNKHLDMFVTSATPEYESILAGDYDYDEKVVKLTGFPRYDLLKNSPKSKIIVAPTWRTKLVPPMDQITGEREYASDFKKSKYFIFYQNLVNDQRIIESIQKYDLTLEFYLHPSHIKQSSDFSSMNSRVHIMQAPYDYKRAFSEGSLLVTDYSSVAFDFAYLNKPVMYTQFDKKDFFEGQMYDQGYFSYEEDGFGPVAYDYESTIESILKFIKSGFVFLPKYQKRINRFYAFHDRNNSKRVYEAILGLDD